ncbi:hypothetical protein Cgig2_003681 [Carnegiea gigantea]|uniref:Uncharacterized protein n=1 Tax=Carnegiea gigantea TaxID=171969 RepID=A0A9Q1KH42_9CARY|nr:hypothetical protein Cgig2_003681 [Carnegiea gigantea]
MGGELDNGGGGKVTYVEGWTKCMVLKEDMELEEVRRKVSEITSNELTVQKLWCSLKYNRRMVMELEVDGDVRMFLKGNDEHRYLYVGESDGPKRRTQKATQTCELGVRGRSGRDRDDMVQQGRNGPGVKRWITYEYWLRVGGEIIEMSDDDEILVVSEDVGEDEAAVQGGEESSQVGIGEAWEEDGQAQAGDDEVEEWAKANLWVHDYVHPIYKTAAQQIIYNQLVHPMETHDIGTVDAKTGRVVGGDELDDDYDRCILPPTNGR